jgi:hypothetical protein
MSSSQKVKIRLFLLYILTQTKKKFFTQKIKQSNFDFL